MIDLAAALEKAGRYIGTGEPLSLLGWGVSGAVFMSHDARTAVKVHHREEQFDAERKAYRILHERSLRRLHGLTIPTPRGFSRPLLAIHMDVVKPPYLLDFAGVLFKPPDYTGDVMASWHDKLRMMYGANVGVAYSVYHSLMQHGMWYMDFRQSNMNLEGLPGLIVEEPADDDDGDFR